MEYLLYFIATLIVLSYWKKRLNKEPKSLLVHFGAGFWYGLFLGYGIVKIVQAVNGGV